MDTQITVAGRKLDQRWIVGGIVGLVIVGTALLVGGQSPAKGADDDWFSPVVVQTGDLTEGVPVNTVLTPARVGAVSAVRGGQVIEVIAYPGQKVKQGDILVKLSNPELEQQLAQTLGERATANAELVSQQADMVDKTNEMALERTRAANDVKVAVMQMEAETKLHQEGIVSLLTLNKTKAELAGKQAAHTYAKQHLVQAGLAARAKTSAAGERMQILSERADNLQASVDALTLRAPFDGVVAKIDGKPGATVPAGTQMAEVITPELQVSIEVSEQFANKVRPGQSIALEGGIRGKVLSLSPTSDGGVVKGRATLEGDTSNLRSNSTLPGEIIMAQHGKGTFVVLPGVDVANKTVVVQALSAEGNTEDRRVQFGARHGQKVVVVRGLSVGDQIVGMNADAKQ